MRGYSGIVYYCFVVIFYEAEQAKYNVLVEKANIHRVLLLLFP